MTDTFDKVTEWARKVLTRVAPAVAPQPSVDRLTDRFTERTRMVLTLALEEAQRLNHLHIGTEHLLLGLVREGDSVASRILRDQGVPLPKVRSAVEFIIGQGEGQIVGEIEPTQRALKVIELAADEARQLNHYYIGTEHLLLGLVREGEGIACGVLESLGVGLENIRTQVMQIIDPTGSSGTTVTYWYGSGSGPTFRDLLQIIAVAQSQRADDIELSLLSLEGYADGFILNARLLLPEQETPPPVEPNTDWEARDDQGNSYTGHLYLGDQRQGQWRLSYVFSPALAPAARELQIHVPVPNWQPGSWPADRPMPGPWAFTVPLPTPEATTGE